MTINKFQGKTESEAIEKARNAMGPDVVIMNVKVVKPTGMWKAFKNATYEVTAALEEKQPEKAVSAASITGKKPESINYAADEPISLQPAQKPAAAGLQTEKVLSQLRGSAEYTNRQDASALSSAKQDNSAIEERLDSLQSLLENRISDERINGMEHEPAASPKQESFSIVKMLYQTLLNNEVNEKYANQILDELEKVSSKGNNIDYILSHIYQKLILKFGQPKPIELLENAPKVVFFIGPTGVGKTTTIAKVASRFKVDQGKKVAFLTADTYRIAAAEQLRVYANILDTPLTIIYSPDELKEAIQNMGDYDLILVDTAGFSHKNQIQCEEIKTLIESVPEGFTSEIYLVLSATTKYRDLMEMCDHYKQISSYKIIFTKLDETSSYGNLLNVHLYSGADLSYAAYGQNVPDDIEVFDTQKVVKKLLGGD